MSHDEEFFEVFFRTRIETGSIERDFESARELRRDVHPHIIAVRTFIPFFWSELESLDPCEKILHIIRSLDIRDILDLTDFHECVIALIVLFFGLDIRIIPEADHFILILKL